MRRPLVVAAGAFVCFGVFWGSWAVATVDVEHYTGLSNAGLGILLSGSIASGRAVAAAAAGQAWRASAPTVCCPMLLVPWGLCSIAAGARSGADSPSWPIFALAIASAGLVDMAMNTAATVGTRWVASVGWSGSMRCSTRARSAAPRWSRVRLGQHLLALDVGRHGRRGPWYRVLGALAR